MIRPNSFVLLAALLAPGSFLNADTINLSDGSVALSNPTLFQYDGTTMLPSIAANPAGLIVSSSQISFDDIESGISFYRFDVSALAGDTLQFDISIGDGMGGEWRDGWGLAADVITDDGTTYDITSAPFGASVPTGPFPELFTVSQPLSSDTSQIYIRAEFYGGDQNGSNGIESSLIVPEPKALALLFPILGFASYWRR